MVQLVLVQFDGVWQQPQASLRQLEAQLATMTSTLNANSLLLLPEMFASGFSMQPALFAEAANGQVPFALARWAQIYRCHLLAGVAQKTPEGRFLNQALGFTPDGELALTYSKQRVFRHANEHLAYQSGQQSGIWSIEIEQQTLNLGVFICYDLRFPELFQRLAKQVELIVVLANWPSSRSLHWRALLQARAIESQCFVVGVNRLGRDGAGLDYTGASSIFSPNGDCLMNVGQEAVGYWQISVAELKAQVALQREHFAFLEERID